MTLSSPLHEAMSEVGRARWARGVRGITFSAGPAVPPYRTRRELNGSVSRHETN